MPLAIGLLYQTPFKQLTDLQHKKHYRAQARERRDRHTFGYDIVKLDQDVTWFAGWTNNDMKEYTAQKGEYLVQCFMQPPRVVKTWADLKKEFHVFRNTKKTLEERKVD